MRQMGDGNYDAVLQMGVNTRELSAKFAPAMQRGEKDASAPQYSYMNVLQQKPDRNDHQKWIEQQQMQQVQM